MSTKKKTPKKPAKPDPVVSVRPMEPSQSACVSAGVAQA